LPDPGQVGSKLLDGLFRRADFWPYIHTTFVEALGGCALGVTVALPLAVIIVHSRLVSAAITPYLGATQAIPAIALAPLLVLWVGYGLSGVVALIALMVFFPILVSAVTGLRHVDSAVLDAASLDGAGTWARLWHMELPLAGAAILAGVRNGFTLSVTGAVVGEMVMGGDGLGLLLTVQRDRSDPAGMIASIVVLAVIASTLYSLIALAERRLFVANRPRYR
jgi:NitT/TauT family transport system permease protein